jgi:hypothetical protein
MNTRSHSKKWEPMMVVDRETARKMFLEPFDILPPTLLGDDSHSSRARSQASNPLSSNSLPSPQANTKASRSSSPDSQSSSGSPRLLSSPRQSASGSSQSTSNSQPSEQSDSRSQSDGSGAPSGTLLTHFSILDSISHYILNSAQASYGITAWRKMRQNSGVVDAFTCSILQSYIPKLRCRQ